MVSLLLTNRFLVWTPVLLELACFQPIRSHFSLVNCGTCKDDATCGVTVKTISITMSPGLYYAHLQTLTSTVETWYTRKDADIYSINLMCCVHIFHLMKKYWRKFCAQCMNTTAQVRSSNDFFVWKKLNKGFEGRWGIHVCLPTAGTLDMFIFHRSQKQTWPVFVLGVQPLFGWIWIESLNLWPTVRPKVNIWYSRIVVLGVCGEVSNSVVC